MNTRSVLFFAIFSLVFVACNKSNTPPYTGTDSTSTRQYSISLSYPTAEADTVELIISDRKGEVLLDTTTLYNVVVNATLKTTDSLVNVTTVAHRLIDGGYYVHVITAVDPAAWTSSDQHAPFGSMDGGTYVNSTIYYKHIPTVPNLFFGALGNGTASVSHTVGDHISASYKAHTDNYTYLLLPELAGFTLHHSSTLHDTVDLSSYESCPVVQFTQPAETVFDNVRLWGLLDSTDVGSSIPLYQAFPGTKLATDRAYVPGKYFQSYQYSVTATRGSNENITYQAIGSAVSSTLPFIESSAYSINSTKADAFSVSFATKPTFYYTFFSQGTTWYTYYASPDSTVLHPLTFLQSLHNKKINALNITATDLLTFGFYNTEYSYRDYFNYMCNPEAIKTQRLRKINQLERFLQ